MYWECVLISWIVLIFEYDLKRDDRHSAVKSVIEALTLFKTSVTSLGKMNTLDVCISYIRNSLRSTTDELFTETWRPVVQDQDDNEDLVALSSWHADNQVRHQSLLRSVENISQYLVLHNENDPPSEHWKVIIKDYDSLIKRTERVGMDIQNRLQVLQSHTAIDETRRALRQFGSVRR